MSREFIIQPNCSLSDQERIIFLCSMGLIMLIISGGMAFLGLWMIAPFMGLELFVLVYVFNKVAKQCRVRERVVIKEDTLVVHHEEREKTDKWSFPLYWVNVDLRRKKHAWYRTKLLIGTHGKWIELAGFLNNEERASLATAVKDAINTERSAKQW